MPPAPSRERNPMTRTLGRHLVRLAAKEAAEEEVAEMDEADEAMEEEMAVEGDALEVKINNGK